MGPIKGAEERRLKVREKANCLSTGMCELFAGRTFSRRSSGTFSHRDVRKSALAGCAFSWLLLFAQARRSDPPVRAEALTPEERRKRSLRDPEQHPPRCAPRACARC